MSRPDLTHQGRLGLFGLCNIQNTCDKNIFKTVICHFFSHSYTLTYILYMTCTFLHVHIHASLNSQYRTTCVYIHEIHMYIWGPYYEI